MLFVMWSLLPLGDMGYCHFTIKIKHIRDGKLLYKNKMCKYVHFMYLCFN